MLSNISPDTSSDSEQPDDALEKYSDTKNVFGVELEKARPVGNVLTVLVVPFTLIASIAFVANPSFSGGFLASVGMFGVPFLLYYRVSERRAKQFDKSIQEMADESNQNQSNSPTKSICRECHAEISSEVKRCPNCGWKPKKRGGLWWGTTAVMSLNPIGWALGAKGASDNYKASKGVAKEVQATDQKETEENEVTQSEVKPADALERINELKEQGVITEEEFEEKKKELLEQI